jgi:hypothetical protein
MMLVAPTVHSVWVAEFFSQLLKREKETKGEYQNPSRGVETHATDRKGN